MAIPMYGNPMMTEEEKKRMMAMALSGRDAARMRSPTGMVMANAEQEYLVRESEYPADYTTGPTVIPPNADMSQYNVIDPSSVVRESEMLNQGMNLDPNSVVRQPETISPMGTPMTPEQIDEEIMRLQMLKNQMKGN